MDSNINNSTVVSSLSWKLMERCGVQGIQFFIQILLARLLMPDDFGTVAIVMVFISLANVFVQSGFNTALIQKKDVDDEDFSSIFYLSLIIAGILYACIYIVAPYIADFYTEPILIPVLRVLSLSLFFGAFNSIQNAYIARNMLFKKLFYSSIGAMILSGSTGVIMAYAGLGIWALVLQQLVNQISVTIILWFTVKWRPRLIFSLYKVMNLFSFGWKLLVSSLLNTLYMELRTLLIGSVYSASILGYYNRGEQFPKLIVTNVDGSIQSVMLPTLSAYQDNPKRVKEMMRRAIVSSSFFIFPMMVGLAVVAEPLVKVMLTDKWLLSVPFLRIFCISYALIPIHTANLQAINALGRSDIFLKLEVIKKIVSLIILGISIPFGIHAIALSSIIGGIIGTFINSYPNKKLLNYSYKEQWLDIIPSFLISIIMGVIVYLFNFLSFAAWEILILQVGFGVIIYIGLAILFKVESFSYLAGAMRQLVKSRRGEQL